MTNLKKLNCSNYWLYPSSISDENVQTLNLTELYTDYNLKIINVQHMTNLKILECRGSCGIQYQNIKHLKLYKLVCINNSKMMHDMQAEQNNDKIKLLIS